MKSLLWQHWNDCLILVHFEVGLIFVFVCIPHFKHFCNSIILWLLEISSQPVHQIKPIFTQVSRLGHTTLFSWLFLKGFVGFQFPFFPHLCANDQITKKLKPIFFQEVLDNRWVKHSVVSVLFVYIPLYQ